MKGKKNSKYFDNISNLLVVLEAERVFSLVSSAYIASILDVTGGGKEKKQHGFSPGYVFQSTYACMTGYYIDSYQIFFLLLPYT